MGQCFEDDVATEDARADPDAAIKRGDPTGGCRFLALIPGRLAFGIKILIGLDPSPPDHGSWPDVPQVACKEGKKMDIGPEEGTVEWVMLRERIKTLPLKLFLTIEKMSYDGAFLADIFPHKGTEGLTLKPCIGKDINLKALGLINRSSHAEYANRVGTENLWIISPGPELLTIGFLRYESARIRRSAIDSLANPSAKGYGRVKRVHLALSREDSKFAKLFVAKTSDVLFPCTRGYCDRWLLFMEFDSNNKDVFSQIDRDLLDRWESKTSYVFRHALDEITLDFRNAFGADGSFLGEQLVEKLEHFVGGILPKVLIIEAPVPAIVDAIRRKIILKNDFYRRLFGM